MKTKFGKARGLAILTALGLAGILAGCGGGAVSYATTPAAVAAAFNAYNHNNMKANLALNTALQNQNEIGTSAQIDNAYYQGAQDQGKTTEPGATLLSKPYVTYPLNYSAAALKAGGTEYFVATAGPINKSHYLYLFAKTGANGHWQNLYEPDLLAGQNPQLIPNGGGYYDGGPLPKHLVASPSAALNDLINYFNAYNTPTTANLGPFATGPDTTGFMASYQNGVRAQKQKGFTVTFTFSQDSSPIVAIPVKGGALAFGAYDVLEAFSWPYGATTTQNAARTNWVSLLPLGVYHNSISINGIVQVAMFIPTKGQAKVLGTYAGIVGATGN